MFPKLNTAYLPRVPMQRIIMHWTAGAYGVIDFELRHYHGVIDHLGTFHFGVPIDKNVAPIDFQHTPYAAHTLNLNSGSIGIAVDCMADAVETPTGCITGPSPFTKLQYDAMIHFVNELALYYNIPVRHDTIFSHAEAPLLGFPQRGKWDFTRLPFEPSLLGARPIGDKIRRDILALRGQTKPVMNSVREAVDSPVGGVATPAGGAAVGYGAGETGNEMLQGAPPADAVPPDLYSQITNFAYTAAGQGFLWAGRLLLAVSLGVALWTAFKYIRYAWRKKYPPVPTEAERARGVD